MIFYRLTDTFQHKLLQTLYAQQILLIGMCGWFCVFITFTTPAQYRIDQWTADTGLPQNSVHDIVQTRDGYLWVSTLDGLARFDGVRFTIFNKSNSNGISSNRFLALREDDQGDLWATTEDGGVVRYHQGRFSSFGQEQGFTSLHAICFFIGDDRNLLVLLIDGTLLRWADEKFSPIDRATVPKPNNQAKQRDFWRVTCTDGELTGIQCLTYRPTPAFTRAHGLPSQRLAGGSGIETRDGVLWLGILDEGLVRIENDKVVKIYTERDGLPGSPVLLTGGAHLNLLSKDKKGNFWLTNIETWKNQLVGKQVPESISGVNSSMGYEDREGNLWFGALRDGLYRARQQSITTYSKPDGLTQNNIYPIYQAQNGFIWIGTTEGLFRYRDGVFVIEKSLQKQIISAIAEDQTGRIFAGEFDKVWVGNGTKFSLIYQGNLGTVWALYPEPDGSLWIGSDKGLTKLKDGIATTFTTKDGLAGDDNKVIIDDKTGGLWIGSYGGLTHYKDGKFTAWTEKDGLPSRTIRSLYLDNENILWIGTYDGGLGRFKDGKFTRYTNKEGLFNNGVFQILEDKRGNFWISSNRGIYRVSRQELNDFADGRQTSISSIAYGKSDGMLNVECNGGRSPAGIITRDGKMWFPTQDGISVINPDEVQVNPKPPPVRIESFFLDRNPVDFDDEVQIQPNQENFEIQYTALSFINSENLRFKYKLEGLDNDWIETGTRRTAYFSHVPPGSYTFRVIAANSDGIWNEEGASIKIVVHPHFYRTWWFITLVALSVSGLVILVFVTRVKRAERERKEQEEFSRRLLASQEQERQRIAAELHDSLGQSLLIIKNRIALAQSDIDEKETVVEQLDELSHSATSAIEECREIAYNLRPYQISRFGLSKTLYGIFMRINEVTKIHATAEIDTIDDLLTDEAQINLYRVVQECVNNIIKHSQATEASLFINLEGDEITLLIQDNGRGFVQNENNSKDPKRGGFGLIGMAERVKMFDGSYTIDSALGQGTNIRIKLKANNLVNNNGQIKNG